MYGGARRRIFLNINDNLHEKHLYLLFTNFMVNIIDLLIFIVASLPFTFNTNRDARAYRCATVHHCLARLLAILICMALKSYTICLFPERQMEIYVGAKNIAGGCNSATVSQLM